MKFHAAISGNFATLLKLFSLTLLSSIAVVNAETSGVDLSFNAKPARAATSVSSMLQPDGKIIVVGDYDGDGKSDAAVFRPSNAVWYVQRGSDNALVGQQFGLPSDVPVPADYDGDGKTNFAVFRPSNGVWYTSNDAAINYGAVRWGVDTDVPLPADYDGDGRADVAVFRPGNGIWYALGSSNGFAGFQWGTASDKPAPAAYTR